MWDRKIALTLLLVMCAVVLSGCGSSNKTVAPSTLAFSGGTLPLAIAQHSYTHTAVATGGQLNYEFELDHDLLPPGIVAEWVDNDLVFHGNGTVAGTYTVPVTVIDANKDTALATFVINVAANNNIAGTWSVAITVTLATQDCAGEEGPSPAVLVTIGQTGSALTATGWLGNSSIVLAGTIGGENGNVVTISGSYPEDSGTTTATHTWTLTSASTMSGTESWSWTDGANGCPGSQATVVCNKVAN